MSDPFAKIITHSISPEGISLITVHMRYWRGIHAEVMTHRVFSRNARSSRAVPIAKMIEEIEKDPFVPRHWGKNQKGMQASEQCDERVIIEKPYAYDDFATGATLDYWNDSCIREQAWLEARDQAVKFAKAFMNAGYHKQIVNRLLEPFMWIDTLVTSTDWANFMALRDHKDAEPHIRDLAVLTKAAIALSDPTPLKPGEWHLPYIKHHELAELAGDGPGDPEIAEAYEMARQISAARCARISYAPFDGNPSIKAELERYAALVMNQPVHASPVEHQATPDTRRMSMSGNYHEWENSHQHRNFRGWRQFRAMIDHETVRD